MKQTRKKNGHRSIVLQLTAFSCWKFNECKERKKKTQQQQRRHWCEQYTWTTLWRRMGNGRRKGERNDEKNQSKHNSAWNKWIFEPDDEKTKQKIHFNSLESAVLISFIYFRMTIKLNKLSCFFFLTSSIF